MVAGHVRHHIHAATAANLRMTLMVSIRERRITHLLRPLGTVAVPHSNGF